MHLQKTIKIPYLGIKAIIYTPTAKDFSCIYKYKCKVLLGGLPIRNVILENITWL